MRGSWDISIDSGAPTRRRSASGQQELTPGSLQFSLRSGARGGAILAENRAQILRQDPLHAYLKRPTRRRLTRVVEAHHEHVWAVACRVAGNAGDTSDICQDAFPRLLFEPPRPDEARSAKGFLAWCVVGRAGKLARAAERRLARERKTLERTSGAELPGEDLEELRNAIADLPEQRSSPNELRYLAGMENREVAE